MHCRRWKTLRRRPGLRCDDPNSRMLDTNTLSELIRNPRGMTLLTRKLRSFQRVLELAVKDWPGTSA